MSNYPGLPRRADYHSDDEFNLAVVAAYDRMPEWQKDQLKAWMNHAMTVVKRIAKFVAEWEAAGVEAAEKFANGEKS